MSESTPNFKVLSSSAVNVVVSHCGLGAAQEALYFGKPLLCIPFFGDQVRGAALGVCMWRVSVLPFADEALPLLVDPCTCSRMWLLAWWMQGLASRWTKSGTAMRRTAPLPPLLRVSALDHAFPH